MDLDYARCEISCFLENRRTPRFLRISNVPKQGRVADMSIPRANDPFVSRAMCLLKRRLRDEDISNVAGSLICKFPMTIEEPYVQEYQCIVGSSSYCTHAPFDCPAINSTQLQCFDSSAYFCA